MPGIDPLAKSLIVLGVVLLAVGVALLFAGRLPFLGRLPGDLVYQRDSVTIYIPLGTMLLLSILMTILLNLLFRR